MDMQNHQLASRFREQRTKSSDDVYTSRYVTASTSDTDETEKCSDDAAHTCECIHSIDICDPDPVKYMSLVVGPQK
jgi:hypothetical protein